METTVLKVSGMSCGGCVKSVTNVQKRLELLHQKLELCSELANFAAQDPVEKAFVNNKRKALLDVVDFLNAGPARSNGPGSPRTGAGTGRNI